MSKTKEPLTSGQACRDHELMSKAKTQISIRLDNDIIAWAKERAAEAGWPGYQSWINHFLSECMRGAVETDRVRSLEDRIAHIERALSKPKTKVKGK